jgi:hypothetical protein
MRLSLFLSLFRRHLAVCLLTWIYVCETSRLKCLARVLPWTRRQFWDDSTLVLSLCVYVCMCEKKQTDMFREVCCCGRWAIQLWLWFFVCVYVRMYACMYTAVFREGAASGVGRFDSGSESLCVYMCVCMHVCMCVHTDVCVFIYTYIWYVYIHTQADPHTHVLYI